MPRRAVWVVGYLVISLSLGLSGILAQPMTEQIELAKFLATMAATVFGILGVWIAVLNPKGLLNRPVDEPESPEERLMLKLIGPWLSATTTFILSILFAAVISLVSLTTEATAWWINSASAMNLCLLLLILDGLIGALLPISELRAAKSLRKKRRENRE